MQICSTGKKYLPSGTSGKLDIKVRTLKPVSGVDKPSTLIEQRLAWDSPFSKQKNSFNVIHINSKNHSNSMKNQTLRFTCRDDYNKRGGALGNIECFIEG